MKTKTKERCEIRLACMYCDREDGDFIDFEKAVKKGWTEIHLAMPDGPGEFMGWYTHLGVCPAKNCKNF